MAKKKPARRVPKKTAAAQKKTKQTFPSLTDQVADATPETVKKAQAQFTKGLLANQQAVPQGTPLPPGATHVINGVDEEGTPVVERKRFSLH